MNNQTSGTRLQENGFNLQGKGFNLHSSGMYVKRDRIHVSRSGMSCKLSGMNNQTSGTRLQVKGIQSAFNGNACANLAERMNTLPYSIEMFRNPAAEVPTDSQMGFARRILIKESIDYSFKSCS
jgi:hypothetical protein